MRRPLFFLLLVIVILAMTAPVALAKPGNKMELVCWVSNQGPKSAYFMTTGSGIVHRWSMDGKHDIYVPYDPDADWPQMPEASGWALWTAKTHADCADKTDASHADYLTPNHMYWHRHN